ncbi:MAG TPA: ABC transporter substrate-binding protein [Anaerolineales bacterium]
MHAIRNRRRVVALLCMGFILSACASATPAPTQLPAATPTPTGISIVDGLGREITLDRPAQKVASLAPSNTEILFAIGAGAQVIARDSFSDFPEQALAVADIGGGFGEIDTETLVSLEPDLVIAAEINPVENVQMLEDLGLKVFYLSNPKELDGLYENLRTVARLVGHEAETEGLIESLKLRVSTIEEKVSSLQERPLVFYELDGTDPSAPWTSGPGTFIDLLLTKAGGDNLGNTLDSEWVQISVEELITQNPDVILLGDYTWGGITPEDIAARPGWEVIAAVQNEQVYTFDDNLVSRPGPRMVDGLEALAELLHPELFQ